MNWAEMRAQLACTDRGDEMCVDGSTPHQRARLERHALTICADCQHLDRCRAWVLRQPDDPSPVMVVGGMTPGQRRRERFGNQTCGTDAGWQRHRKNGQRPCPACLAAHNAYTREHKRAWRAKKKNERQQGDAA
jgi:hypothetical protein